MYKLPTSLLSQEQLLKWIYEFSEYNITIIIIGFVSNILNLILRGLSVKKHKEPGGDTYSKFMYSFFYIIIFITFVSVDLRKIFVVFML